MNDRFSNSNWLLFKAYYNGTDQTKLLTFEGVHYYFENTTVSSSSVQNVWGVVLIDTAGTSIFAPWSVLCNKFGEIGFLVNPNEVIFDGITL